MYIKLTEKYILVWMIMERNDFLPLSLLHLFRRYNLYFEIFFFFIETENVILTMIFFSAVVPCQNLLSFVLPLPRK